MKKTEEYQIQEKQYDFPYHYIAELKENGDFSQTKVMGWGYEYMSYISYVVEKLSNCDEIIDIGTGDGRLVFEINKKYKNKKILGVDVSKKLLCMAKLFVEKKILLLQI